MAGDIEEYIEAPERKAAVGKTASCLSVSIRMLARGHRRKGSLHGVVTPGPRGEVFGADRPGVWGLTTEELDKLRIAALLHGRSEKSASRTAC